MAKVKETRQKKNAHVMSWQRIQYLRGSAAMLAVSAPMTKHPHKIGCSDGNDS